MYIHHTPHAFSLKDGDGSFLCSYMYTYLHTYIHTLFLSFSLSLFLSLFLSQWSMAISAVIIEGIICLHHRLSSYLSASLRLTIIHTYIPTDQLTHIPSLSVSGEQELRVCLSRASLSWSSQLYIYTHTHKLSFSLTGGWLLNQDPQPHPHTLIGDCSGIHRGPYIFILTI